MSSMSKVVKNHLVCITGKMGSGKTTAINNLKENGYNVFIFDDYIKEIYKKNGIGYKKIIKYFGKDFVNEYEVDRNKLLKFILSSSEEKNKLDNIMIPIIINKIKNFPIDSLIFVELGIYIYFDFIFAEFFQKIIIFTRKNENCSNDKFFMYNKSIEFSTKHVGNSKKHIFSNIVYGDIIVENNGDLAFFYSEIKKMLQNLKL